MVAFLLIVVFIAILLIFASVFTVQQSTAAIVERFGRFSRVAQAGFNTKLPFVDHIARRVSLRIAQHDTKVEAKTKDGTFVTMPLSIQFRVLPDHVRESYYNITDPIAQIESLAYNVILAHLPTLTLDDVYSQQSTIGASITHALNEQMENYGYEIVKTLITDVSPSDDVRAAMNAVQAAQRSQQAATAQGEADRIKMVAAATAEMQSKVLQGQGIAGERSAIIEGLKKSVEDLAAATGVNPQDAMALVVLTQYFDTLAKVAGTDHSNTIMLSHSPSTVQSLLDEIRNSITVGQLMAAPATSGPANTRATTRANVPATTAEAPEAIAR